MWATTHSLSSRRLHQSGFFAYGPGLNIEHLASAICRGIGIRMLAEKVETSGRVLEPRRLEYSPFPAIFFFVRPEMMQRARHPPAFKLDTLTFVPRAHGARSRMAGASPSKINHRRPWLSSCWRYLNSAMRLSAAARNSPSTPSAHALFLCSGERNFANGSPSWRRRDRPTGNRMSWMTVARWCRGAFLEL